MPNYYPSFFQQGILNEIKLTKVPDKLSQIKRFVTWKDVQKQEKLNFEIKVGGGLDLPNYVTVSFQ